mmetsp:Transcript_68806/g.224148  ORF Transcript_68806/g.224148 Transcript_68806/m.224148 type:complete len:209 (-) Transcript_68806:46-672(-)
MCATRPCTTSAWPTATSSRRCMYEGHMVMISSEPFQQFRGLGGVTGPHFNASVFHELDLQEQALLFCLVILPRVYITGFLLWIGCRLLVATSNFSDVLLNACALEFILLLKDLLYLVCVPRKTAYDLDNTKLMPSQLKAPDSLRVFLGATWWAVFALAVVFGYIGLLTAPWPWQLRERRPGNLARVPMGCSCGLPRVGGHTLRGVSGD